MSFPYWQDIVKGFGVTLQLFGFSAVGSLLIGALVATLQVSPLVTARALARSYLNVVRNIPVILIFMMLVFGLPSMGYKISYFAVAIVALSIYEAAPIAYAIISGFNSVPAGEIASARALGFSFFQIVRSVALPQAIANSVPMLTNCMLKLLKSTAVAEAFGVAEAVYQLDKLIRVQPSLLYPLFFELAAGFLLISLLIVAVSASVQRKLRFIVVS